MSPLEERIGICGMSRPSRGELQPAARGLVPVTQPESARCQRTPQLGKLACSKRVRYFNTSIMIGGQEARINFQPVNRVHRRH